MLVHKFGLDLLQVMSLEMNFGGFVAGRFLIWRYETVVDKTAISQTEMLPSQSKLDMQKPAHSCSVSLKMYAATTVMTANIKLPQEHDENGAAEIRFEG